MSNIVKAQPMDRTALAQSMEVEIDIMVNTANRFPRDLDKFESAAIAAATTSQATAEAMTYSLPARKAGDKPITGRSVKLARLLVPLYKNLRIAVRASEPAPGDRLITASAGAMDLENNVIVTADKHRRITKSDGTRYNDDMVTMTMSAASAIAYREAVFSIIDPVRLETIYKAVLKAQLGDPAKIAQLITLATNYFTGDKIGLKVEEMCKLVDKDAPSDLTLEDLRSLNGFKVAIDAGELSIETLVQTARGTLVPSLDLDDLDEATTTATNDAKVPAKPKPETAKAKK